MAHWLTEKLDRLAGRPAAREPAQGTSGRASNAQPAQAQPVAQPAAVAQPVAAPEPPGNAPPGNINHYTMKQTLGVGAFGKVKLAEHKETHQLFAIKCIQRSRLAASRQVERLQREIRILKMLRHPNVIQLHEVIETESDIYLVMEHVSGGDLLDFINSRGAMPEAQARELFGQITCGLQFCHSLGVAHRDLKPENILINEQGVVKITDFGLSNMQQAGEHLSTLCGSPYYAAPELLDGSTTQYDGTEADVWSVGVITFAILCGELPFDGQTLPDLFAKITAAKYTIPAQLNLSPECQDILAQMLVREPSGRRGLAQLRSHAWLQGPTAGLPQLQKAGSAAGPAEIPGSASMSFDLNPSSLEQGWAERNLGKEVRAADAAAVPRSLSVPDVPGAAAPDGTREGG